MINKFLCLKQVLPEYDGKCEKFRSTGQLFGPSLRTVRNYYQHVHLCPITFALVAQSVEHHHGKVGVSGSNPLGGFSKGSPKEIQLWQTLRKTVL